MLTGFRLPVILALVALGLIVAAVAVLRPNGNDVSVQGTASIIDTGTNTWHIDPVLWGMIYKNAAGESTPSTVAVYIATISSVTTTTSLEDQITAAGGSKVENKPDAWNIPIGAVAAVMQRPDVQLISLVSEVESSNGPSGQSSNYSGMNDPLSDAVRSYQNGVPENQAALKALYVKDNTIAVAILASTKTLDKNVRNWLTARDIHVRPPQEQSINADGYDIGAMLPVSQAPPPHTRLPHHHH